MTAPRTEDCRTPAEYAEAAGYWRETAAALRRELARVTSERDTLRRVLADRERPAAGPEQEPEQ